MTGNDRVSHVAERCTFRRRALSSFQETSPVLGCDASDWEPTAVAQETLPSPLPRRSTRFRSESAHSASTTNQPTSQPYSTHHPSEQQPPSLTDTLSLTDAVPSRRGPRRSVARGRRRGGSDSASGSPSRGNTSRRRVSFSGSGTSHRPGDQKGQDFADEDVSVAENTALQSTLGSTCSFNDLNDYECVADAHSQQSISHPVDALDSIDDTALDSPSLHSFHRIMSGAMKRSRDKFEATDAKDISKTLKSKAAVAVTLYKSTLPNPEANDIWPECRSTAKLPARYFLLDPKEQEPCETKPKRRASKATRRTADTLNSPNYMELDTTTGRSEWKLPVELVELIASYLNRDDVKSLRLVSRELNYYASQVIFKTVVVPFNTEIYGMLGQETRPDLKGKKRAKVGKPGYSWKNANRDEVYNGHGLDVFRGFGKHILKYGMSFEVNEDSLSMPPTKLLTEKKTSFWGSYDWPFEEYRRFEAVAGLETAADETPRMTIAFSELSKVRELALSINSGLGWLNGPDRSIRARVLDKPPQVFGVTKGVPDRRTQAQQELWDYIEACHQNTNSDVRLATLYRIDKQRALSERKEFNMLADKQPDIPYLDPRLIYEATPHDTADIQIPLSFDDPEVLDRFVSTPSIASTGVLFSSTIPPTDAGQLMNPIIPANLTTAQKEWLLETEWAQRAFLSSYMLSIIDNPITFNSVHTLNISRLSDRYLSVLNRPDFWHALPSLANVTLIVIPEWRSVHKDEAGFVFTSKADPAQGIGPFCELLRCQVAPRANIRNLTIGWATGGEHAEGLHARNKLLLPVPLMGAEVSEMFMEDHFERNGIRLLCFPHLEQLTLRNCWITPSALLQLIKLHDPHGLKRLILDSISLTAVFRPQVNGNQAAQQAAAINPPLAGLVGAGALWNVMNNHNGGAQAALQTQTQLLPNQQQFLQIYMQTLQMQLQQLQVNVGIQQQIQIAALQNQLQQQVQQLHNQTQNQNQNQQQTQVQAHGQAHVQVQQNQQAQTQLNFNTIANLGTQIQHMQHQVITAQPPPAPVHQTHLSDPQSFLKSQPRPGSWMNIIDIISPGTNLSDFGSEHSHFDKERCTSLQSIEFISCGYAKLPYASFDQTAIEAGHGLAAALRNPFFTKRLAALAPAMLNAKWAHLGEIVQEVDLGELAALDAGWNLKTGWNDVEKARAVEFDGLLSGGTGRFTGKIQASDRMAEGDSTSYQTLLVGLQQCHLSD